MNFFPIIEPNEMRGRARFESYIKNTWPRITFKCMPFATNYKQIHSLIS